MNMDYTIATQNFIKNQKGVVVEEESDSDEFAPAQEKKSISSPFFSRGRKLESDELKLSVVSKGSIFGVSDLLSVRPNTVSIRCCSMKGIVKMINADEFMARMKQD
jgi:hypothetical protein